MQWYGTILPRIHSFVPADTILEIACGYGRWTQFLKDLCRKLIVIDLSDKCLNKCKQRFAHCSHISYFANDGKSLDMAADASVDFVFSFDSLVHADHTVIEAYLAQLPRVLKMEGAAFLHHSNLGEYPRYRDLQRYYRDLHRYPYRLQQILTKWGILEADLCNRDPSVSAASVAQWADKHSLCCVSQEIIPWATRRALIDCMSIIVRKGSLHQVENRVLRNTSFMREVEYLSHLAPLYTGIRKK